VIVGDRDLRPQSGGRVTAAVGDEPEEDVKLWTISKLRLAH